MIGIKLVSIIEWETDDGKGHRRERHHGKREKSRLPIAHVVPFTALRVSF